MTIAGVSSLGNDSATRSSALASSPVDGNRSSGLTAIIVSIVERATGGISGGSPTGTPIDPGAAAEEQPTLNVRESRNVSDPRSAKSPASSTPAKKSRADPRFSKPKEVGHFGTEGYRSVGRRNRRLVVILPRRLWPQLVHWGA